MSHKIAYREHGHGPILLLLHGYGGSVMHWDPVLEELARDHRVVVPNLSHLYMSKDRLLFNVIVEAVADFVRATFPGERVSPVGSSFGGALAWGLAALHPDLVERMVLLNPVVPHPVSRFLLPEARYFFVVPMEEKAVTRLFATPIGQSFLGCCAEIFRPDRASAERSLARLSPVKLGFVARLVSHFAWILRNEDWKFWEARLAKVPAPALVAWSRDDRLFDPQAYEAFAASLPLARTHAFESGGHVLSKSQPAEVARLCLEFLAKPAKQKPAA